jgi:hypothetical protein
MGALFFLLSPPVVHKKLSGLKIQWMDPPNYDSKDCLYFSILTTQILVSYEASGLCILPNN